YKFCPVSGSKGLIVKKITMRNHIQEKYWDIISDTNYFFCPQKKCPIIYFNNEKSYYFLEDGVKTRVAHKDGEEPRPICYCLNVLEHRILDEIVTTKRATSLEDIKKYTGARTGKLCHINNPSGRCCGPQVNEVIAKGIELLSEETNVQETILETVHSGCEYCQHEIEYLEPSISLVADTCKACKIDWEKPDLLKL
ncbi:hypothetical protein LCGC14_2883150, partial [marine sediment metagenome]